MTQFTQVYPLNSPAFEALVHSQVEAALQEDIGSGDLTALLIPEDQTAYATILAREPAIICGQPWANACFKLINHQVEIEWLVHEGASVEANQTLCRISGPARALLSAERCALNFLQTLSSTATETRRYVERVAGTGAQILDTRKTIPQLRLAQKYAVSVGGGYNQRLALYDGILIKENHITAAGSIQQVMQQALLLATEKSIQIEVENLAQLSEALTAGATSILLDNFSNDQLREAVKMNHAAGKKALLEASGNINLNNVREVADTGVDRISIGALTKNIKALDLSMRISELTC